MGATNGRLAFLLAFTFGMTATCFDNRKPAVMQAARYTTLAAQNLGSV